MFSSPSYSEWTAIAKGSNLDMTYIDLDRIRKKDGYVYWWELMDFKESAEGFLSIKRYKQGDCSLMRWKLLSGTAYKEQMGVGEGKLLLEKVSDWMYAPPTSANEIVMEYVCNQ